MTWPTKTCMLQHASTPKETYSVGGLSTARAAAAHKPRPGHRSLLSDVARGRVGFGFCLLGAFCGLVERKSGALAHSTHSTRGPVADGPSALADLLPLRVRTVAGCPTAHGPAGTAHQRADGEARAAAKDRTDGDREAEGEDRGHDTKGGTESTPGGQPGGTAAGAEGDSAASRRRGRDLELLVRCGAAGSGRGTQDCCFGVRSGSASLLQGPGAHRHHRLESGCQRDAGPRPGVQHERRQPGLGTLLLKISLGLVSDG